MKDYAALEAAAAQNPRLNDVLVQQGENFISLRSTFGLWLKKEGRQINAPTVESLQEYPPGYDMVLDFTQAVDSKVHFKQRTVPLSFVCLRPKEQWETIRSGLENALQGRWLEFYFSGYRIRGHYPRGRCICQRYSGKEWNIFPHHAGRIPSV